MRVAAIALALLVLTFVPQPAAAAPVYERYGAYTAGVGASYFTDSCAFYKFPERVWSNCIQLPPDNAFAGLTVKVRDEGAAAALTQGMRVCFYTDINVQLRCPDPIANCAGWAFCGIVPAGSKYAGVTSATGADVRWHLVIE